MTTPTQTHFRTCNLCEAMCGLEIELRGEEILAIRGDKLDPFSQGHICPKATALADIYHDPDRLRQPVRRTAVGWEPISWDEAFDEVAANIKRIQEAYGRNAIAVYQGNPNVHNLGAMLYSPPFVRTLRTQNRFSATSVDQLPHHFAAYFMFGHQLLLPIPDVDRTDFLLMLGANPLASNGSLMTAPGIADRLKKLQKRGGQLVVIDPRRTETAVLANTHHFIKPGSDVLLLLALLHTIFSEGLAAPGPLAALADGLDQVQRAIAQFTPERVAGPTGIPAEAVRQLARDFAGAKTAVCYGRIGVSTQQFGGLCHWLINLLNFVTGNLDSPGGAMFTTPAIDVVGITAMTGQTGRYGRWHSRVRNLPEFGGELPVAALAKEMLTPGDGQIKGMITIAGNPVLSTPNGRQLDEALAGLEFMVAIDIYINETTRHANIILPPTTGLETEHYDLIFHALAVRNTAKFSPALLPPAEDARHDWQIFQELRARMESQPLPTRQSPIGKIDFFARMQPAQIVDLALRFGPYGAHGFNKTRLAGQGLKLPTLKREAHGVDLGPLKPNLKHRLATPNRRIQLAPELFLADLDRVREVWADHAARDDALLLIGRRQLRSNNSWLHNSPRLVRGKERCTLLMHPEDAQKRHLADGAQVTVQSRTGTIQLPLALTDTMMPGVVSIPHGWGHDRDGVRLETAVQHPGASINDLTDDQQIDQLTGNAAFCGVPVMVKPG
ncbi:MAG: molybdopterin-dependent oxidoreductase [Ardenticatenaceae bacterium]|nr:molybdopterin oxidoreductase family protein [Anaerolineales bacterium]MCB8940541.1 molybdopterin-dependent oxidoreductase [Ardenticatenaceae bacterium]MCB8973561.1 molybdopterin-dependent oxidoreductase [Ardenticatenaceae bacterium]